MNPIVAALEKHRLLLLQDKSLPNAVTVVTGEHPRGSWWSHPRSHEIFRLLHEADLLSAKLIAGKVTFVHESLWPALFAVGNARESWQLRGLTRADRALLRRVDRSGEVRASAKELERRLLVRSEEVHTESGRHETILRRWPPSRMSPEKGRVQLEQAVIDIGGTAKLLPWTRRAAPRSSALR